MQNLKLIILYKILNDNQDNFSMYHKLRANKYAELLIIGIRFLLGLSFMPSGIAKLAGERFTALSTETPIGYFFEALYQTGLYWQFLGFCQVFSAFLLFTQRFALLGALFFFGISLNIFMITISMDFTGTWIITSLMLFAAMILLSWDWYKLLPILGFSGGSEITAYKSPSAIWQVIGLTLFIGILSYVYSKIPR